MNFTVKFTGALPAVAIVSTVLTALVSVFLLWLYRRKVLLAMSMQAGITAEPQKTVPTSSAVPKGTPPVLTIIDSASQPETAFPEESAYSKAIHSLNQATIVYAIGGLVYALVLTSAWMIAAKGGFFLTRFLWLFSCYTWPTVLVIIIINPAIRMRIAIPYFAIILVVAGIGLVHSSDLTAGQLLFFWLLANGPGTVLLLAFLNRHVRAISPLVLAFMVAGITGAVVIIDIVADNKGLIRGIANVGSTLGLGAITIFVLLLLIGFALFGLFGWRLLRLLGRGYQKKRMSDQSITLDALWLLFGLFQTYTLVFEDWGFIFTGLVAFVAFKLTVKLGFKFLVRRSHDIAEGPMLLLLRVFSLGQRSERLLNVITRVWLRTGSISLISGPDLVTATVEPHEFLDFIGGRLSRQFIQDEKDLEQRVSQMDTRPDPDGRHRVNEFFCRADTWQITMQQLAMRSNAVIMDLRSFSKSNQGCIFELKQLLNSIALDRVMLIIDDLTDRTFLEMTVGDIWQNLEPSSPNIVLASPSVRCFSVTRQDSRTFEQLVRCIFVFQT